MYRDYSQNVRNDGQGVVVPGPGPADFERALKWLKRKVSNSGTMKILKQRQAAAVSGLHRLQAAII